MLNNILSYWTLFVNMDQYLKALSTYLAILSKFAFHTSYRGVFAPKKNLSDYRVHGIQINRLRFMISMPKLFFKNQPLCVTEALFKVLNV